MGYDATACLVLGVRVSPELLKSKLYVSEKRRSCNCTVEAPSSKFCPDCGAPVWEETKRPIEDYCENERMLSRFKLVTASSMDRDPEYIAFSVYEASAREHALSRIDEIKIDHVKQIMKEVLEPLGLWDESKFGLHLFLYESC